MIPIETERLTLRKFSDRDADDILAFSSDPSLAQHLHLAQHLRAFPGPTFDSVKEYLRVQEQLALGSPEQCVDLAVELKSERRVIGLMTMVCHADQQGEVGFAIHGAYQRKGYATEALRALLEHGFTEMGFHRIFSSTGRMNISSWMLLERVGMRKEAVFLQDHLENGQWHDSFVYAMLKSDWLERSDR